MNSDGATIFFWNWIGYGLDSNFTKFMARLQVKRQLFLAKIIIVNENVFKVDYQPFLMFIQRQSSFLPFNPFN